MSKAWSIWCTFVLLLAAGTVCGEMVQVTVRLDGEPRVDALVQAYSTEGVYLGLAATTDAYGVATFDVAAAVEAKYRTVHCGTAFWTAPLIAPATATIDLPIASTITVTCGGQAAVGRTVQLWNQTGTVYLGEQRTTGADGTACFAIDAAMQFRFRIADSGSQHFTGILTAPVNTSFDLPVPSTVVVTYAGEAGAGLTVQLWSADQATYLNQSRTTDVNGNAQFSITADQAFRFRATYGDRHFWTGILTAPATATLAIPSLSVVSLTVTSGGEPAPGRTVQVWNSNGTSYLDQSKTTSPSGQVSFLIPTDDQVRLRVTESGTNLWTGPLTAPADATLDIPVLSTVTVTHDGGAAAGRTVQMWSSDQATYLGTSRVTDATGVATFTIVTGSQVKFRVTDNGVNLWSDVITAPASTTIDIPIASTVTVTKAGAPVEGRTIYLFDSAGTYLGQSKVIDANGVATFTIATGMQVKFRVADNGVNLWSELITAPASTTIDIPVASTVTVTKAGAPVEGRTVYLFDPDGTYLGQSKVTDANGLATFTIATGSQVKFRVTDNGVNLWSDVITAPASTTIDIPIASTVTVTKAGAPVEGRTIYLFDPADTYLGQSKVTDANGMATFTIATGTQAKFRVADSGIHWWSNVVTAPAATAIQIPLPSTVTVTKGGEAFVGTRVYAFDAQGTYTGQSQVTDAAGVATFSIAEGEVAMYRVTDNERHFWSTATTTPATAMLALPLESTVRVLDNLAPVVGLRVYAFSDSDEYLGYSRVTNGEGIALFSIVPDEHPSVKFRVTYQDVIVFSESMVPPDDVVISFGAPQDTTPPVTSHDYAAVGEWATVIANIMLTATDDESGVAATRYQINDNEFVDGTSVVIEEKGINALSFYSVDAAGNEEEVQTITILLDLLPPVTLHDYEANAQGTHEVASINFKAYDVSDTTTFYSVNGGPTVSATQLSIDTDGDHLVSFYSVDTAGNTETARTLRVMLDRTLPQLLDVSPANGAVLEDPDGAITFELIDTGSGIDPYSVYLQRSGYPATRLTPLDGAYRYAPTEPWTSGTYYLQISAKDLAANTASFTVSYTADMRIPEITQHPYSQTVAEGNTVQLSVMASGSAPLVYRWFRNGELIEEASGPTLSIPAVSLDFDESAFYVGIVNQVGAVISERAVIRVLSPLSVTSLSPNSTVAGIQPGICINGAGFTDATKVVFDGLEAELLSVQNSTEMYVRPPLLYTGTVDVEISDPISGSTTLQGAFTVTEALILTLDGLANDAVVWTSDDLVLNGTIAGGHPPYNLRVIHYSEPTEYTYLIDQEGPFTRTVPLAEGLHYAFVLLEDSADNLAWTRFYYGKDTTPPEPPSDIRAYVSESGTGVDVFFKAPTSLDAVEYLINGDSHPASPVRLHKMTGLTEGEVVAVEVLARDRAGNLSSPQTVIATAQQMHDLHELKKAVEEKRIGLSFASTGIVWSDSFGTIGEAQQLCTALETFDDEVHEDYSNMHVLRRYVDYDTYGLNGRVVDPSWPKVRIPGETPWLPLGTHVTTDAVDQLSDAVNRVSLWKQVPASEVSLISYQSNYLNRNRSGNFPWQAALEDLPLRVQQEVTESSVTWYELSYDDVNWWGPYSDDHALTRLSDITDNYSFRLYGSSGDALYNNDGMYEWYDIVLSKYVIPDLTIQFPASPVYDAYFWTDHAGTITPGQDVCVSYPADDWVSTAGWADPAGNLTLDDWWQQGESYIYSANYGQVSPYVYSRHLQRPLELIATIVEPAKVYAEVGEEVIVKATAIYAAFNWGAGNGIRDPWESYTDSNGNNQWDEGEPFDDTGKKNGAYDFGEPFTDSDGDGVWDEGEPFSDANGNGVYDDGEYFSDLDGDGVYDPPEPYEDLDAVFVHIPSPIRCEDPDGYVNNFGGSAFVGLAPPEIC